MLPAQSFKKRQSLRDQLDRIDTLDDESAQHERYRLMDELDDDLEKTADFRWHAPKTQNRQDHHLSLYTIFVLKWLKGLKDEDIDELSEDEQELLLFPNSEAALGYQLNM